MQMQKHTFSLPEGKLFLTLPADTAPADFFTVAARDNPNRAFLFVSKLLGKHLPTSPAKMAAAQQQLAAQLDLECLREPVLFIGMAETATALARGVYEAWLTENSDMESLYLATTRYQIGDAPRLEFAEAHSHAPALGLHIPRDETLKKRFFAAKTLVLIDDEISTGNTFVNLVKTLQKQGVPVENVVLVSLTDFTRENFLPIHHALAPLNTFHVHLLFADWAYQAEKAPQVSENWRAQTGKWVTLPAENDLAARLGTSEALQFSAAVVEKWRALLAGKKRVLVLGCGEFMHAPFVLAKIAEDWGTKCVFCATTRSPIRLWSEMKTRLQWSDPYGEGVQNFLYNYQRDQYDAVFYMSEVPANEILRTQAQDLGAVLLILHGKEDLQVVN